MFSGPTILRGHTMNDLYYRIALILNSKVTIETELKDGRKTKELPAFTGVLQDPYERIVTLLSRKTNMRYLAGEMCFYIGEDERLSTISAYSKFWNKVSDDGLVVNSAYGKRLFYDLTPDRTTHFNYAFNKLAEDIHTRKAIMLMSRPEDMKDSKDNVCTLTLQFFIRNNQLNLIVNMRSCDIWYGFTYDVPFFTFVQELMLERLNRVCGYNLTMGLYIHQAGSLHAYEKDFDKINTLVEKGPADIDKNKPTSMARLEAADAQQSFMPLILYEYALRVEGKTESMDEMTPFQRQMASLLKRSK